MAPCSSWTGVPYPLLSGLAACILIFVCILLLHNLVSVSLNIWCGTQFLNPSVFVSVPYSLKSITEYSPLPLSQQPCHSVVWQPCFSIKLGLAQAASVATNEAIQSTTRQQQYRVVLEAAVSLVAAVHQTRQPACYGHIVWAPDWRADDGSQFYPHQQYRHHPAPSPSPSYSSPKVFNIGNSDWRLSGHHGFCAATNLPPAGD